MKSTLNYLAAKTRPFCKPTPSLRTSNWSFPIINNFKLIFDLFMEPSSLEQAVWYEGTDSRASCCIATTFGEYTTYSSSSSSRRWNDGCCGLSILEFAVTCQKEYSTIFLYNFTIQDADDTPNHRIFEPRADKQTPMWMHDVDAPSPPKNDQWT